MWRMAVVDREGGAVGASGGRGPMGRGAGVDLITRQGLTPRLLGGLVVPVAGTGEGGGGEAVAWSEVKA
jgi:hypothetical protein